MSDSTFALPYKSVVDLRLAGLRPAFRSIRETAVWLGGGVLFAATIFMMVALPGFID